MDNRRLEVKTVTNPVIFKFMVNKEKKCKHKWESLCCKEEEQVNLESFNSLEFVCCECFGWSDMKCFKCYEYKRRKDKIKENYKNLSVPELAKRISPSSDAFLELKERGILRTKNVVGELGEYFAVDYYTKYPKLPNLTMAPPGVQNIDALSRNGEIYSIKTVTSRNGTTGSFWDPDSIERNEQKFHYLIIVVLNNEYSVDMILELTWKDFFKFKKYNKRMNNYNISLTKKLFDEVNIVFSK